MVRFPGQNRATRALAALAHSRSGATAVEFSLVMIPFLALTLAIIETSVMVFTQAILQGAVSEAARLVRTGQSSVQGSSGETAFSNDVCTNLFGMVDCTKLVYDLRSFTNFSAISIPVPDANGGTSGASYNTGVSSTTAGAASIVTVRVIYPYSFLTPGLSVFLGSGASQTVNLVYTVVFQNEPY